jgi:two-component system nitrate/nitrite response regulator NarL
MEPPVGRSLHSAHGGARGTASSEAAASEKDRLHTDQLIRVLFISDLLMMRAAVGHLLEASQMRLVGEAANCEEALSLTASERPDIILLDLDSRSDGLACVRQLALAAEASRIIVLTDRARAGDFTSLMEMGAMGVVLKHESPEVLIKAIRKVHAGEIWLDRIHTAQVLVRAVRRRRTEDLEAVKIAALTRREREIISLVGEGLKNRLIAERLFISEATVRNHLTSVLDKLGLSDRLELAVYAYRAGLAQYPDVKHPHGVKTA